MVFIFLILKLMKTEKGDVQVKNEWLDSRRQFIKKASLAGAALMAADLFPFQAFSEEHDVSESGLTEKVFLFRQEM